jgi:two-component system sensor histidine kinase ChvG
VAVAFDGMVARLRAAADAIRQGAEEHAHAFKTPIAVIAQSIEPLRHVAESGDGRGRRAIDMIERSLVRLDTLVAATRRIDHAIAESVDPRLHVNLSSVVAQIAEDFRDAAQMRGVSLRIDAEPDINVLAGRSCSECDRREPPGKRHRFHAAGRVVAIGLRGTTRQVVLTVEDDGPGVEPTRLATVFDRYYSSRARSAQVSRTQRSGATSARHSGLGLWIVRRNVNSIGGRIDAGNRPAGGFSVASSCRAHEPKIARPRIMT